MSWAVGFDEKWKRDIGYGVPSICDHSGCNNEIDRGLSYVCGSEPYGGEHGCGLFFCNKHLRINMLSRQQKCDRCLLGKPNFKPKPDTKEWNDWKKNDESWAQWRQENPELTKKL